MNLYRLDYESLSGETAPVRSVMWGGDYLTRSWSTARADALEIANQSGAVIRITRISGAGQMTVMAHASGETHRIHRVKR